MVPSFRMTIIENQKQKHLTRKLLILNPSIPAEDLLFVGCHIYQDLGYRKHCQHSKIVPLRVSSNWSKFKQPAASLGPNMLSK